MLGGFSEPAKGRSKEGAIRVKLGRFWAAGMAGASVALGLLVVPAGAAVDTGVRSVRRPLPGPRAFTPAAADPRLAALVARGGFDPANFRFTPAETGRPVRGVTVAVRARTDRVATDPTRTASTAAVGITPSAYNLGAAVKWKRVTIAGDVSRIDLPQQPGGRESADLAVTYSGARLSGRVRGLVERPLAGLSTAAMPEESYSLDASTSYSLTRNLNVTAGVRYRTDRERLARMPDDRRESQAVYVGTAFRF